VTTGVKHKRSPAAQYRHHYEVDDKDRMFEPTIGDEDALNGIDETDEEYKKRLASFRRCMSDEHMAKYFPQLWRNRLSSKKRKKKSPAAHSEAEGAGNDSDVPARPAKKSKYIEEASTVAPSRPHKAAAAPASPRKPLAPRIPVGHYPDEAMATDHGSDSEGGSDGSQSGTDGSGEEEDDDDDGHSRMEA
jgi:hypothetical protein